ncbi:MAG: GNAT family N-acetyltransferase [Methanomicrobiales archaeon]|jgi:GNAT superfamily N-acetyltransferase|nr:GNAT family N-acetyltransferase [Methanomicrobiales archaeon]
MEIREIYQDELPKLLALYTHLHDNTMPVIDDRITTLWNRIISDADHHIIIGIKDTEIISSCVLLIIPNLTHEQRPYAVIENVVTHTHHRNKGYATKVLTFAREIATRKNCYKIMLMTGSKDESVLRFYENAGYNKEDKTAFIQWL